MACCPSGSHGAAPESGGSSTGKEVEVGEGLRGYFVPSAGKGKTSTTKAILVCHDVYGPESGRTKAIMERLAEEGYASLMPSVFESGPVSAEKSFIFPRVFWLVQCNTWRKVGPKYETALAYLEDRGYTSIGLLGFCWGAYPITYLLADSSKELKCGLIAHPSLRVFSATGDFNVKRLLEKCRVPIAYLAAGNDAASVKPDGLAHTVTKTHSPSADASLFKLYPHMRHGWVNRGDLQDSDVLRDYNDALQTAKDFFAKNL